MTTQQPPSTDDVYRAYLDALRDTGVVNMYGATAYLERDFDLDRHTARQVVLHWMEATRHAAR